MSSYFTLELDTTPPKIELFGMNYTTKGADYDIEIRSSEPLMLWQDIYIIDSSGSRIDVILAFSEDRTALRGTVAFRDVKAGLASIYAQLKDEVGNLSNLAVLMVNVLESMKVFCKVETKGRRVFQRHRQRQATLAAGQLIVDIRVIE